MSVQIIMSRDVYLDNAVTPITLANPLYAGDAQAQRIRFRCFQKHGQTVPMDLTGTTITAHFIRPDDGDVVITGTAGSEWSYVDLPQACYAYKGLFKLLIRAINGDVTTSILYVTGRIDEVTTDTIIDPGHVIPSLEELLAKIEDCEDATQAANTAADGANAAAVNANAAVSYVASAYDATLTYSAGEYAIQGGKLYRCLTDIETAEAWTAAHWTEVSVGGELSNLKTAFGDGVEMLEELTNWVIGYRIGLNKNIGQEVDITPVALATFNYMRVEVHAGDKFLLTGVGGSIPRLWGFTDTNNVLLSRAGDTARATDLELTSSADGYLIVNVIKAQPHRLEKMIPIPLTEAVEEVQQKIENVEGTLNGYYGDSPYYKDVNFGNTGLLNDYYKSNGTVYNLFDRTTVSSLVYEKFDELMSAYPNNVSKSNLGNGSDGNPIYSYTFKPVPNVSDYKMPKIIIISGQHGNEKSSVYGLYYFFRDVLEKWAESPVLDYMKNHVEFITIPIVNRYGFDNIVYKNANGVNLNRNYDTPEFVVGEDPSADDYGGAAPFDQPETQIVRDLVNSHTDAFWFMDWHTNGQYKVTSYQNINWIAMTQFDNEKYTQKAIEAARYHLANITVHLTADYAFNDIGTDVCGYLTIETAQRPTAGRWVKYAKSIIGHTFETNNGFPNETGSYSENEQKANAEIMGNWLATIFSVFSKYQTK